MSLKETFIKNLAEISTGKKQKELAEIMGCSEGTMSKYLNSDKKDFPTAEMLYNLADYFDVSIDWLLGRSQTSKVRQNLSTRDICKLLISVYETPSSFRFGCHSICESCYYPTENESGFVDFNRKQETHTYTALYFPEWDTVESFDEIWIASEIGNNISANVAINKFLRRLIDISKMLKRGDLNKEMYDRLLESYLNDVPDK